MSEQPLKSGDAIPTPARGRRRGVARFLTWGLGLLLLALVALVLLAWLTRPRDPVHHGRPLTAWMQDLISLEVNVRAAATNAIQQLGTNALPALVRHLGTPDPTLGRTASDAQRFLPRGLWVWAMKLTQPRAGIERRWQAAAALGLLGAQAAPAVPALTRALHDVDPRVRDAAIEALRGVRPAGLEALASALATTNITLLAHLCSAIGRSGPDAAVVARQLARAVPTTPLAWQSHLRAALIAAGAPAVTALVELLGSETDATRDLAVATLQAMTANDYASLKAVAALLQNDNPQIRQEVVRVLSGRTFWDRRSVGALTEALGDPTPAVRLEAIRALGVVAQWSDQATNALPTLRTLLAKATGEERAAAAASVEAIEALGR